MGGRAEWLSVRSADVSKVLAALGASGRRQPAGERARNPASQETVDLTVHDPVDGWLIVESSHSFPPGRAAALSEALHATVQHFIANDTCTTYGWAWFEGGRPQRQVLLVEGVARCVEGTRTAAEIAQKLNPFDPDSPMSDEELDALEDELLEGDPADDVTDPGFDEVMALADAWSVSLRRTSSQAQVTAATLTAREWTAPTRRP